MDRVDLLRVFVRIAASGSFSQAADQLGLTRPSVSLAMQQLEARLGTRLLHRTTRRVSLTPDGQTLLDRAQAVLADMEELEQQFRPSGVQVSGRLRVDVPSRIARRLIAPALPALLQRHPQLEIELGSSDRTVDLVHDGVDAALRVGQVGSGSLVARPLGQFALINCASPAYLAQHGTPQHPDDLAQHLAVDYLPAGGGRAPPWEWLHDGQPRTLALRSRVAANNVETYIACALAGLGLIQVPAYDVDEHLRAGELVRLMHDAEPAGMPVHLVYPHRRHRSQRLQVFLDWVQALLRPHLLNAPPIERGSDRSESGQ